MSLARRKSSIVPGCVTLIIPKFLCEEVLRVEGLKLCKNAAAHLRAIMKIINLRDFKQDPSVFDMSKSVISEKRFRPIVINQGGSSSYGSSLLVVVLSDKST